MKGALQTLDVSKAPFMTHLTTRTGRNRRKPGRGQDLPSTRDPSTHQMHQRVRAWRKSSPRTARTWSPEPRAARTWGRTDAKVAFVRRRTRRQTLCHDVD